MVPQTIDIDQQWLTAAQQLAGKRNVRQVALTLQLKQTQRDLSHRDIAEIVSREVTQTAPSTVTRILAAASS